MIGVGLDMSEEMLSRGRERTADAPGNEDLAFLRANALNMPFVAEFDVVVGSGLHTLERPAALRRADRPVLKPGRRFFMATSKMPPIGRNDIGCHGLSIVRCTCATYCSQNFAREWIQARRPPEGAIFLIRACRENSLNQSYSLRSSASGICSRKASGHFSW